jgi:large subunit ribosomal protein L15
MLDKLTPAEGSKTRKWRVGRGSGSGNGKTCGKGGKGQSARSGGFHKVGFEGGQMPLARRLPKRGFNNRFRVEFAIVNLRDIDRIPDVTLVDVDVLVKFGMVGSGARVKVLAEGDLSRPLTLKVHKISASAAAKVDKAGGKVEII